MSQPNTSTQTPTQAISSTAAKQGLAAAITGVALILALVALYAVFLDQGTLLSPVLGKVATTANYLHELAHDGRHLLGAPCH